MVVLPPVPVSDSVPICVPFNSIDQDSCCPDARLSNNDKLSESWSTEARPVPENVSLMKSPVFQILNCGPVHAASEVALRQEIPAPVNVTVVAFPRICEGAVRQSPTKPSSHNIFLLIVTSYLTTICNLLSGASSITDTASA